MTHYDTEIIAYNSVIIVTRFADVGNGDGPDVNTIFCKTITDFAIFLVFLLKRSIVLFCILVQSTNSS